MSYTSYYNCLEKIYPDGTIQRRFYEKAYLRGYLTNRSQDSPPGEFVEQKEVENLSRAKQVIYDLARSNHWDYMVTLTFDASCVFRDDYDSVTKVLGQWTDLIRKKGCKWLLVPEYHLGDKYQEESRETRLGCPGPAPPPPKAAAAPVVAETSGPGCTPKFAYHFHGLVQGELPVEQAHYHNVRNRPDLEGKEIWYFDKAHVLHPVLDVANWKYGFSRASSIVDQKRVASYITKYITKETKSVVPKGRKRYWASRSLQKPKINRLVVSAKDREAFTQEHGRYVKTYKDIFDNKIILVES